MVCFFLCVSAPDPPRPAARDRTFVASSRSKRSNVRRLVQNFCGKARVRKDTIPLVWCIIVNLLDEVVMHSILPHQNVLKDGESKNIRIKVSPPSKLKHAGHVLTTYSPTERGRVQRDPEPPGQASRPPQTVCGCGNVSWSVSDASAALGSAAFCRA